jgi:hypothetical protein
MDNISFLIEQYKIIEQRRNYCGNLFWKLPAFFITIFAVFTGVLVRENTIFLNFLGLICFVGGILFFLISFIAYRLKVSQDNCESLLEKIENEIRQEVNFKIIPLPRSRIKGARYVTILFLLFCGISLMALAMLLGI